jgi:hypothetical protein
VSHNQKTLHTPAYENSFAPNADKIGHLLAFAHEGTRSYKSAIIEKLNVAKTKVESGAESTESIVAIIQEAGEVVSKLAGGLVTIHGLMPVLMVTIVEAYLKDVLIYAARMLPTLMEQSEQTASYTDVLSAQSLQEVIDELRGRWAKKFVDKGGPTGWMKSLEAMGVRGYRHDTLEVMETLWGVRHLMVHSAGIVTADFIRRHPSFKMKTGDVFTIRSDHLKKWLAAIYDFVDATDLYFVKRFGYSRK